MRVCLLMPCGHLLGRGWPLGSCLICLLVNLSLSAWYPLSGVVLNCIDSDLSPLSYFKYGLYHGLSGCTWIICCACGHIHGITSSYHQHQCRACTLQDYGSSDNKGGMKNTIQRIVS